MAPQRDWFYVELVALLGTLVAGAVLRYWLSTVLPFDARELATVADAAVVDRGLRVAFIMLNGASLFALYLLVRRSAGVAAAFTVLLALQTSLAFQDEALRIRLPAMLVLPAMVVLTYLRFQRPPWRVPQKVARVLVAVVAVLAVRGAHVMTTLPGRLHDIAAESRAEPGPLLAAVRRCGGGVVTPREVFRGCEIPWPTARSLDQQEAMIEHGHRLGRDALVIHDATTQSTLPATATTVVLDPAAAAFIAVPDGPLHDTTVEVVRAAAPEFAGWVRP